MRVSFRSRLLVVFVVFVVLGVFVSSAVAFVIEPGSFSVVPSSDQAGAHVDLKTSFGFARDQVGGVGGVVRDAEVVLPVGFAAYPTAVKTCTPVQLKDEECPVDAQIGTIEALLRLGPRSEVKFLYPLYNMVPSPDETVVFGFVVAHGNISGNVVVSLGPDYRAHAVARNVIAITELVHQSLTVWGVPADASHNAQRGSHFHCEQFTGGPEVCSGGGVVPNENLAAYLANPTQCTAGPLTAELVGVDSWEGEQAAPVSAGVGPFTGCESLTFAPSILVAPEETQATVPTGYAIDLRIPQTEGANSLSSADLRDTVLRMPRGVVLSPSAATGLVACTEAELGMEDGNANGEPVRCPSASKLGDVSLTTPALTGELKGALYLGGPPSGVIREPPFDVYLTLAGHGVLVKVKGSVVPDPVTGQVTTVFDKTPEAPFSELRVQLDGGSRAPLANPGACVDRNEVPVEYSGEGELTPWSSPLMRDAVVFSPPFRVRCRGPPRFAPSFDASTTSNQAGGYSPLSVTFSREDGDEDLGGITVVTPPGLSGNLSKVPLCSEPQAALGMCPEASLIGEVTAGAGPGPEPVFIKGGRVYLTGPYNGAPFGLSIDVSEKAGPLDLGTGPCDCEVVRASVSVDPHTAQLTVTNGALPTMKDGIPFQVKKVNVLINRPEFVFNPTSCDPMSVTGTLTSTQGMTSQQAYHFQVTNCAALAFNPGFRVSTSGRTSRANGASLDARLTYPSAPFGSQANIALAKVELPRQLPSRLTTLQKACTAAVFEANPANCPVASRVGVARALTPVLPVPLTGPAIFVSHGGEAFPSLIVVLQGYGVTVDLVGSTFINEKSGVTTSTFKTVPDVPVGSFELYLPEGPYSALAAHGNLCKSRLVMPSEFVSQDASVVRRSTPITVTGCPKTKTAHKAHKARKASRARRASRGRDSRQRYGGSSSQADGRVRPSATEGFPTTGGGR